MSEKQKAIQTSSKVIAVIMKIGYTAMIVGMSICAVSLLFIAITGSTAILTSGGTKIAVGVTPLASTEAVVAVCVAVLIMCAFLFAVFFLTYRMFREINATGTPFNAKYVKTIKCLGILVAAMAIVGSIVDSVAASFAGMETLGICTDASGVIFGVLIYCLAYVFDYGCMLQQQSDETL